MGGLVSIVSYSRPSLMIIANLRMDLFEAMLDTGLELEEVFIMAAGLVSTICPSYKHQDQYLQDTTRMYLDRIQSVLVGKDPSILNLDSTVTGLLKQLLLKSVQNY